MLIVDTEGVPAYIPVMIRAKLDLDRGERRLLPAPAGGCCDGGRHFIVAEKRFRLLRRAQDRARL